MAHQKYPVESEPAQRDADLIDWPGGTAPASTFGTRGFAFTFDRTESESPSDNLVFLPAPAEVAATETHDGWRRHLSGVHLQEGELAQRTGPSASAIAQLPELDAVVAPDQPLAAQADDAVPAAVHLWLLDHLESLSQDLTRTTAQMAATESALRAEKRRNRLEQRLWQAQLYRLESELAGHRDRARARLLLLAQLERIPRWRWRQRRLIQQRLTRLL